MLTTKYITPTDYLNYFGVDLNVILPDDDLPSGKAERFIKRVEDTVASILEVQVFRRIDSVWLGFSEYQKECYKKALLYQAYYMIENGDLTNESGYDSQSGKNSSNNDLKSIELSRNTVRYLIM